jgi:hypothetical protein
MICGLKLQTSSNASVADFRHSWGGWGRAMTKQRGQGVDRVDVSPRSTPLEGIDPIKVL